ncbi:MAG: circularly permuted type 2 ATP-grasp protein [Verrucomicrobiales bacterium]
MPAPTVPPRHPSDAPSAGHPAYRAHGGRDELFDAKARPFAHWETMLPWFESGGLPGLVERQTAADRMLADQGATINVYSDVGATRPWEFDVVPLLVSPQEWEKVQAGVEQRAVLLEALLADLHGPCQLLADGVLPPALVHSNPEYLPSARAVFPTGGHHLSMVACDLLRGSDGLWRVLRDYSGQPAGLGQVVENRSITSALFPAEFNSAEIGLLGSFFEMERHALRALAPPRRDGPTVVVLSPGFTHPAYFEHAYKARLLGFPLVEGADLTVRERRLFLKTLDGLRPVDVVLRRIPGRECDPLELWTSSFSGVAGLIEAWRSGNVAIANAPGSGLAGSPAFMPFLPGVCRALLGEDLKLPFVETWWLGQPGVLGKVTSQIGHYCILPVASNSGAVSVRAGKLDAAGKRELIARIREQPHAWVAQKEIQASTAPTLEGRKLVARPFVWRAFALAGGRQAVALRGGLARIGDPVQPPGMWAEAGGLTKDIWIPAPGARGGVSLAESATTSGTPIVAHHRPASEVPSRIGEQLFWLGRYAERLESTTRMLRAGLRRHIGEGFADGHRGFDACIALIRGEGLLAALPPANAPEMLEQLLAHGFDPAVEDGLPWLLQRLRVNAAGARDRLSDDTWRLFSRFGEGLEVSVRTPALLAQALDNLILHLAAFSGMQAENMTRGHGWRFLEIGRRAERCLFLAALLESARRAGPDQRAILEALLEIGDSSMTYRRRHYSAPRWDAVVDLLVRDATNPRSIARQVAVLKEETLHLPGDPTKGYLPELRELTDEMTRMPATSESSADELFPAVVSSIGVYSNRLTEHYFSHASRRVF